MTVHFYEKPGCINNTKQKKLLEEHGHFVIAHSLLTEQLTVKGLKKFFEGMSVPDCFNSSNPQIKSGEINPYSFSEEAALEAMITNPLFIRRPLIEAEGEYACGFDNALVKKLLGEVEISHLQSCPNVGNKC